MVNVLKTQEGSHLPLFQLKRMLYMSIVLRFACRMRKQKKTREMR